MGWPITGFTWFWFARHFGNFEYYMAKTFERQHRYKDSCYAYAICIIKGKNGVAAQKECEKKIKYLCKNFGPFDYADMLERINELGDLWSADDYKDSLWRFHRKADPPEKQRLDHVAAVVLIDAILQNKNAI